MGHRERREGEYMSDTNEIKIKIYNNKGEVTKEETAQPLNLRFGTVRRLMELLNIENAVDTGDLIKTVYAAWDDVREILGECFPNVTADEWENVRVNELFPVIILIIKATFSEMMKIPTDRKNA